MAVNNFTLLSEKDGRGLASAMLVEVARLNEESGGDQFSIEPQYRNGSPQNNIIEHYLGAIFSSQNTAVLNGFCSVLTDYIGGCVGGAVTDPSLYEKLG